ncbi:hypothetical protein PHYSODRAFT_293038 [Phytophthora sojae]|uniref:Uncharacterized protein n=1 Tax=Phytophthora sojae (strain P6497) TaxID=1094619 RepID=G4YEH0_PHYSP|nr:hypothetical protein PHYSODRAFT_293038 [Phytophthora sojae]EGZ26877.1 hypothetical protein PHYSODRAFT_293038 [Phytophthora sojae]|eukprot:XP_009514152.1 hypothetical protein PHYSODRAFT_293038 [Phytophthora sojae]
MPSMLENTTFMSTNKTKKQRTAPSLADLVVLLDNGLVSFLSLRDIRSLILVCPRSVSPEARDGVATALIRQECSNLDIHLGTQCYKNWCQLVPATIEGVNHSLYCDCDQSVWDDNDLADFPYHVKVPKCPPLPSLFDARPRLLDAMQLIREGIIEHCGYVFQLICLDNNDGVRFGTFQPVMVSVTTALEAQLEATTPSAQSSAGCA